jgi:trigger factor
MQTKVNKISETKIRLDISLDLNELKKAEDIALVKISKETKVPGFRNGNAPLSMVKKYANPKMLEENILDSAIISAISSVYKENDLHPVDRPSIDIKKYVPGEVLEFSADSEVLPEIKLGDYKKLNVKKQKTEVTDSEVKDVLEKIQHNYKTLKPVDREVKDGDEVIIDFVGKKDDVPFEGGTGKDYHLNIGSGQFIKGFESGIIGHSKGDDFDLDLKFPEDYPAKNLCGEKVVFSVKLNEINEVVLPEFDDELAKKTGAFPSLDALKKDIKDELQDQKTIASENEYKDNLVKKLVEISKLSAPEIMIDDQVKLVQNDIQQNLLYQGLDKESYIKSRGYKDESEWLEKEVKPLAEQRVKAGLVLSQLARVENITSSDEEITEKMNDLKKRYGKDEGALKQLQSPEVRQEVSNRIVTEKTIDFLANLNK